MNERLKGMIAAATTEWLSNWTDERMVGRAYDYVRRIEDIAHVDGYGVVAKVRGTDDYCARVFLDERGGLESECSCPVHHRCKHAVAVVLRCQMGGEPGAEPVRELESDSAMRKDAESVLAAARKMMSEDARRRMEARMAKEREEDERRKAVAEVKSKRLALFRSLLEKMRSLAANDDVKSVLEVLEDACSSTDDDIDIMPYGHEIYGMLQEMSRIALEVMERSAMSDCEKIVYAHFANTPYLYYETPTLLHDVYWNKDGAGRYAAETWAEVGHEIKRRVAGLSDDDLAYHEACHHAEDAAFAFLLAGDRNEAASVCAGLADFTYEWEKAADMLLEQGRIEEAKAVLLRGMRETYMGDGSFEDFAPVCEKYADALSASGSHGLAATVRAAAFLFRSGGYAGRRTLELYRAVLAEADKAHAREATRMALMRILKTGVVPKELAVWGPSEISWRRPGIKERAAPPWPLPPLPKEWELRLSETLWYQKDDSLSDQELVKEIEQAESKTVYSIYNIR